MDCQSRVADFASAFLARDQSTATDFELVGRARHSVPAGALACPDVSGRALTKSFCVSELVRVRESMQYWIVPRRPQVFDHPAKDWIQQRIRVHHVQIQGDQFAV